MIKGYSTYKHFRNHSWLARGRGAKPWDHTRPTYPKLPHTPATTSVCAPRTRNNKHSRKEHKPSYSLLTYSKRRLKTHSKSSHVSRKSKTQRYHNVTHLLVRRKPYSLKRFPNRKYTKRQLEYTKAATSAANV